MLIGVGCARIIAHRAACGCGYIALVVLDKILKTEGLAGVSLYAFHDALATYRTVIGNVVVHARVLLRAEYATTVHVAALEYVDNVAVAVVVD